MAKIQYPYYKRQRPNTTINVDDSALGAVAGDSDKNIIIVGSSEGGEPHTLYELTSFPQARGIFKGGELLDAIELAWSPSDTLQGAGRIFAMRADEATQAKLDKDPIIIESIQYGDIANKITVELTDNAITSTKRLRVRDTATNDSEVFDNLGNIFVISYKGSEALSTATIKDNVLTLKTGATVETLTTQLTYDLASPSFELVSQLITDISSREDFEASFVPYGDKNINSVDLDPIDGVDLLGAGTTLTGLIGDLIKQSSNSQYVNISRKEGSVATTVTNFSQVALSGGSKGSVPASWANLFQEIANDDAPLTYYLVPVSPLESIHAEASSFVNEQSNAGYAMRAIVGGALGETYSQTISRQVTLYNGRVSLVGFDATVRMADGRIVLQPAYMLASMVAGLSSGLPVGEPITYKQLRIASLGRPYTSEQLDQLHLNGVVACEKVRNLSTSSTFRIVSDVTTYNVETDATKYEMSLGEETDYLVMELRESLDNTFVGVRMTAIGASTIKTHIQSFLLRKQLSGQIVAFDPANISVVIIKNRAEISFVVSPAVGLSYINASMIYETTELTSL